jgi:OmpA-OmpF porin, OOP family
MTHFHSSLRIAALLLGMAVAVPTSALAQPAPSAEQMIEQLKPVPRTRGLSRNLMVERAPADAPPVPAAGSADAQGVATPSVGAPVALPAVTAAVPVATASPPAVATAARPSISLLIQFDFDSVRVRPESRQALANLAQALQSPALAGSRFAVEGHTDAKGNADYNLKLSQRRAEAVRDYLGSQGVATARLTSAGLGDTELANPDAPFAAENRRVRIVNLD